MRLLSRPQFVDTARDLPVLTGHDLKKKKKRSVAFIQLCQGVVLKTVYYQVLKKMALFNEILKLQNSDVSLMARKNK